jgi:hypothetical protein
MTFVDTSLHTAEGRFTLDFIVGIPGQRASSRGRGCCAIISAMKSDEANCRISPNVPNVP